MSAMTMLPDRKRKKPNSIRIVQETPLKYTNVYAPVNLGIEKERFLKHGIAPAFVLRATQNQVENLAKKPGWTIRYELLQMATGVLERVCSKFGSGDEFIKLTYGEPIDHNRGSKILTRYLQENNLDGQISIVWSSDLDCSARMMWHGPNIRYNKPEARRHTLIIKNSTENVYLREQGIVCLANHEIGTHFIRSINDGLQPWFSDRKKFSLRGHGSRETMVTEEGLAALNTILMSNTKLLFGPALLYYTACKSSTMSFQELFDHLYQYVRCPEQRWKHVMRVKRSLPDPREVGGNGMDQCYFQGAVQILQRLDDIDLTVLFSGTIGHDEVFRVHRLARTDCLKLPLFMVDVDKYKRQLRNIGLINGILTKRTTSATKSCPQKRSLTSQAMMPRPPSAAPDSFRRNQNSRFAKRLNSISPAESVGENVQAGRSGRGTSDSTARPTTAASLRSIASDTNDDQSSNASSDENSAQSSEPMNSCAVEEQSDGLPQSELTADKDVGQQTKSGVSGESKGKISSGCHGSHPASSALTHIQSLLHRISSQISSFVYCSSGDLRRTSFSPEPPDCSAGDQHLRRDPGSFHVQTLPPRRNGPIHPSEVQDL